MAKVKLVVEPAMAAEVPPAPVVAETKPARVMTFWAEHPRKIQLPAGEVEFKSNKLTLTDEKLIEQLLVLCGDKHRIWAQN